MIGADGVPESDSTGRECGRLQSVQPLWVTAFPNVLTGANAHVLFEEDLPRGNEAMTRGYTRSAVAVPSERRTASRMSS
jgi:hypothetical protein